MNATCKQLNHLLTLLRASCKQVSHANDEPSGKGQKMRRKIRGAVYDTDSAKEIASWPSVVADEVSDYLYRTKSGKYFTFEFNEYDNEYDRGIDYGIHPKSRQEAIAIACRALGVEKARQIFEPDGGEEKTMSVRVSARTYNTVRDVAAERGVSMGQYIEELVNEGGSIDGEAELFERLAEEERERVEREKQAAEHFAKLRGEDAEG